MQDPSRVDILKEFLEKFSKCSDYLFSTKAELEKELTALLLCKDNTNEQNSKIDEIKQSLIEAIKTAKLQLKQLEKDIQKLPKDIEDSPIEKTANEEHTIEEINVEKTSTENLNGEKEEEASKDKGEASNQEFEENSENPAIPDTITVEPVGPVTNIENSLSPEEILVKDIEKEEIPKLKIRLVALEKLLDPNFTKTPSEKSVNNNSSIIILDSDEDDAIVPDKISEDEPVNKSSSKTTLHPKLKRINIRIKKDKTIEKMALEENSRTKASSRAQKAKLSSEAEDLSNSDTDSVLHKLKQTTSKSSTQASPSTSKKHHRKSKSTRAKRIISGSEDECDENVTKSKKEDTTCEKTNGEDVSEKSDNSEDEDSNETSSKKKQKKDESESDWKKSSGEDDDESIGKRKTVKRSRIKENKSSDSEKSTSDSEKKSKTNKKRRRIRTASDSDKEKSNENETRKKLKKIIKTKDLESDTKKAAREEDDRRKRVEERQKLYNQIFEKPEVAELDKFVLDFDAESKEELLCVDQGLTKKLKPHQVNGIKFMWDACFESLKQTQKSPGTGCILGHCMGLGKTLQVVALTHTLLVNSEKTNVERVLIITPLSTVTNWAREYHHWMRFCKKKDVEIYDMSRWRDKNTRAYKLKEWHEEGGVCILGYDMFRILVNAKNASVKKKMREDVQKSLISPGPDIVVCDEGHLLKNEKTSISKAVSQIQTKRRIVLTGTPLQNNLKEYYSMIQFVKPNLLGTYKEYLNRFVNPITNGQYTDSTPKDIQLMKNRSHVLHKLLEGSIQRRDYAVLAPYLPPKHEYVVFITLTEKQQKLYEYYMTTQKHIYLEAGNANGKGASLFQDHQNLRRIWTHPLSLQIHSRHMTKKRMEALQSDSEGSLRDFIDDDGSNESTTSSDSESDVSNKSSEDSAKGKSKAKSSQKVRRTRQNANQEVDSEPDEVIESNNPSTADWWTSICKEEELNNLLLSSKLQVLFSILQECESIGDKLLLFSQSLQSLDVIEHFLALVDKKTNDDTEDIDGDVNGFSGHWTLGCDYFRLDGSNSVESREYMCKSFNNANNLRARLFLISTRAGCLGINLVAANRVIIFDASWNPSHDTQSIFRVYRFGQTKPCYIYRFIAKGTMEEKIYERQVTKQATAKRVIDEQQISRHYNQNDLLELYKYELVPKEAREIPILPKDRLFADVLTKNENVIFKYHEHDSLLENEESENLNEEERKTAWAEYEAEKNRPEGQYIGYNRPIITTKHNGPVTSSKIFGFRSDVLLRLLNIKVKRDHPTIGESECIQMVPIYLQQLYSQMNSNNNTLYRELLDLHAALEVPQGYSYLMNPMSNYMINPYFNASADPSMPTQSNGDPSVVYEID